MLTITVYFTLYINPQIEIDLADLRGQEAIENSEVVPSCWKRASFCPSSVSCALSGHHTVVKCTSQSKKRKKIVPSLRRAETAHRTPILRHA
nr:hypothetical protein HmN_000486600 [Hymenolepis microstoma]